MKSRSYKIFAAFMPILAASCAEDPGAPNVTGEAPPELILSGVTYRYYEGSDLKVSGNAREVTYRTSNGAMTADRLFALFHGSGGEQDAIEATATEVQGNMLLRWADASGGVQMNDINGTRAVTDKASYDAGGQRIFSESPVDVTGKGLTAVARSGFLLPLKGDRVLHFQGPIESTVFPEGTPPAGNSETDAPPKRR